MKHFFKNITLFSLITVILFVLFFYTIEKTLSNGEYIDYAEWNDIYKGNADSDLLIIGSSRARKMVDPQILNRELNRSVYNLGFDGYKLPFQAVKYQVYRQHNHKPKYIIQIVDHFTLQYRENLYNIEQFLPYLKDTLIKEQTKQYEGFSYAAYHVPYMRYFGKSNIILAGVLEFLGLKKFTSIGQKGYYPRETNAWESTFDRSKTSNPNGERVEVDSNVFVLFENMIRDFSADSIVHFIVYAPEYIEFQNHILNRDSIADLYKTACKKSNTCIYIDYKDSLLSQQKKLFYNPTHLNKKGAELFTFNIAKYVKQYLENTD